MSKDKEIFYLVMKVFPWHALKGDGVTVRPVNKSFGFMMIFRNREDAARQYPEAEIVQVEEPPMPKPAQEEWK